MSKTDEMYRVLVQAAAELPGTLVDAAAPTGVAVIPDIMSFDAIEDFAKKHALEVCHLTKRDGSGWWTVGDHAYALYNSLDFFAPDCCEAYGKDDVDEFLANWREDAEAIREEEEDDAAADAILRDAERYASQMRKLRKDEVMIFSGFDLLDTCPLHVTRASEDNMSYAIGLVCPDIYEEEDEDNED